ncbi:uncharacterized protein A1O5_03742 [Cladophialophora psammophila CBS 110553]|uniref:Uncharacterized protein n=1 Tax=Cladophialophora psammophila CBS 110553 TaxID=1182543 RepID=W9X6P3_9EURO|nr:uncharacterized protein A1O5_03742 [Cladophialophora psammophila CBS 110553]EXJ72596.1 hypothetical protein A1O5_03742 [Cladophialophora psammophila CBS 110553]
MFYALGTNDEWIVRKFAWFGGDVNLVYGEDKLPLLAFAIVNRDNLRSDTNVAVATLLSLGTAVDFIPNKFYSPFCVNNPYKRKQIVCPTWQMTISIAIWPKDWEKEEATAGNGLCRPQWARENGASQTTEPSPIARIEVVDCITFKSVHELFGPGAPYNCSAHDSLLSNFLARKGGQPGIEFLDEFEKTTANNHDALLIPFDKGMALFSFDVSMTESALYRRI